MWHIQSTHPRSGYLLLLVIHCLIAGIAFEGFFRQPATTAFCSYGDGIKNMFTLQSYVQEVPRKGSLLRYESMNYPYGEYVYYTDNTPLFAIPYRLFCHYVYDISEQVIPVFNGFIILNIILSGLILYFILRRLLPSPFISFMLAIILPWVNIQVMRIWRGHYNLSFSALILVAIAAIWLWHRYRHETRKRNILYAAISLFCLAAFLVHGYYLPIISLFLSAMLFVYGLYYRKEKNGWYSIIAALLLPVVAVTLSYGTLMLTDSFLSMRQPHASGYDWMEQKTRFKALITPYPFNATFLFPESRLPLIDSAEQAAYLGNTAWVALLMMGIALCISGKTRRHIIQANRLFFRNPLTGALFFGGAMMLFISLGEKYYFTDTLMVYNIFNPFLYLHMFTDRVEQFRSLERFVWPFFYSFNIWVLYLFSVWLSQPHWRMRYALLLPVLFAGCWEVKDYVHQLQLRTNKKSVFREAAMAPYHSLSLDFSHYQALLPFPYYHVGSENYHYTIDDVDDWGFRTFQLSLYSGLPLMATMLSRTAPVQSRELLTLISTDSISPGIRERLNTKPVLIALHRDYIEDSTQQAVPAPEWAFARNAWIKGNQFVSRHGLEAVDSSGSIIFYAWYPFSPDSQAP